MSFTNWPVVGRVRFIGARPAVQIEQRRFTHEMVGARITLEFNDEWDEFPHRSAGFMVTNSFGSSKKEVIVQDISDSVEIPAEILTEPYTKVFLSIVGKDAEADERAIEIITRINAINVEMLSADYETSGLLLDEYKTLHEELESLSYPKKVCVTPYCPIGVVCPKCNYGY